MRSIVLRYRAVLFSVCCVAMGLGTGMGPVTTAVAAAPQALPTHFAGEALTVALAFCFPALAAGAYLGLKRINTRLGGRSVAALLLAVAAIGATAYLVEDAGSLLQRAGLASLAP